MAEEKWYSNRLTAEQAKELKKEYAKIESPVCMINDNEELALNFSLRYETGSGTNWQLTDTRDIRDLLIRTKAYEVSKLEGKVVEAFTDGNMLKGLSVNQNLV